MMRLAPLLSLLALCSCAVSASFDPRGESKWHQQVDQQFYQVGQYIKTQGDEIAKLKATPVPSPEGKK